MSEIHCLTVSEWQSHLKRLHDLELNIQELTKLVGNGNKSFNSKETQTSVETEQVEVELNAQPFIPVGPEDVGVNLPGSSTTDERVPYLLTLTSENIQNSGVCLPPGVPEIPTASGSHEEINGEYNGYIVPLPVEENEKPYKCLICPRSFTTRGSRSNHSKTHKGPTLYACYVCGIGSISEQWLQWHINQHELRRPLYCRLCPKVYTWRYNLQTHMRVHTGEKPYLCHICSKSFTRRDHLNQHIRVHTGDRPFKCQSCPSTFKYPTSLSRHLKTHNGDQPVQM